MNKFREWYVTNQDAITWFLIGTLTVTGLHELAKSNYVSAAVSFSLAVVNYALRRVRV